MKKNKHSVNLIVCVLTIVLIATILCGYSFKVFSIGKKNTITDENRQLIQDMGVGINIGNSLDACNWNAMFTTSSGNSTETSWGNPAISEQYIQALRDRGFGTVRIPVTYMNHIDRDGNIDQAWLNRVAMVVNWVIARDMYCIIDIHHDTGDGGWIKASEDNYEANKARVANMITQIAFYFKDYPDKLILEGFNEMNDEMNHWDGAPAESYKAYNKWNQLFVDKVRETGSNNVNRYLLVNTYAATFKSKTRKYFDIPKDSANNRLLVGVHNYPKRNDLEKSFDYIKKLSKDGYPIIIGEFGSTAAASFDRAEFASTFVALCKENGYCPIWWDNGVRASVKAYDAFIILDRKTGEPVYGEIVNSLISQ